MAKDGSLGAVKRAVVRWRRQKSRGSEPMPAALWQQAVEASERYGRSRVARELGLNHSELKRRSESGSRTEQRPKFVTLPIGGLLPAGTAGSRVVAVELEDATGARIRVLLRDPQRDEVLATATALWAARQ